MVKNKQQQKKKGLRKTVQLQSIVQLSDEKSSRERRNAQTFDWWMPSILDVSLQ